MENDIKNTISLIYSFLKKYKLHYFIIAVVIITPVYAKGEELIKIYQSFASLFTEKKSYPDADTKECLDEWIIKVNTYHDSTSANRDKIKFLQACEALNVPEMEFIKGIKDNTYVLPDVNNANNYILAIDANSKAGTKAIAEETIEKFKEHYSDYNDMTPAIVSTKDNFGHFMDLAKPYFYSKAKYEQQYGKISE